MELDFQKAIIKNKQYYVVPEEIFPLLKLSEKEKKGLLKMEFGGKFYLVPTFVADKKPSSEEIEDFVSALFKDSIGSSSCEGTSSSDSCGVTTDDPCGRNWDSGESCGYESDHCGRSFRGRSSC